MTCPSSSSDDFFGQDAQYAALGYCNPQSFSIDDSVEDEKTVLKIGLMWQQAIPTSTYTWADAVSYCSDLNYAGYSDWRLPNPHELLTIVYNSSYGPAINTTYFPSTPSKDFWSSSTYQNDTSDAWTVDFGSGYVSSWSKTYPRYFRCVRGATLPLGSFESSTVNSDVIVTDSETGLIWQKTYKTDKTWKEALNYCETLTYAGFSDWRLPNKNELASLVNYEKLDPASDFPDMPGKYFWSSSTYWGATNYAWIVNFAHGKVDYSNKSSSTYVRCVRSNN